MTFWGSKLFGNISKQLRQLFGSDNASIWLDNNGQPIGSVYTDKSGSVYRLRIGSCSSNYTQLYYSMFTNTFASLYSNQGRGVHFTSPSSSIHKFVPSHHNEIQIGDSGLFFSNMYVNRALINVVEGLNYSDRMLRSDTDELSKGTIYRSGSDVGIVWTNPNYDFPYYRIYSTEDGRQQNDNIKLVINSQTADNHEFFVKLREFMLDTSTIYYICTYDDDDNIQSGVAIKNDGYYQLKEGSVMTTKIGDINFYDTVSILVNKTENKIYVNIYRGNKKQIQYPMISNNFSANYMKKFGIANNVVDNTGDDTELQFMYIGWRYA